MKRRPRRVEWGRRLPSALVAVVAVLLVATAMPPTATLALAFLHPATTYRRPRRPATTPATAIRHGTRGKQGQGCSLSVPPRKSCEWARRVASFEREGEEDSIPGTDLEAAEQRAKPALGTRAYDFLSFDPTSGLLRLAIFPLRKSVRLPTEPLTLNLYEDRYLALAEHVLQRQKTRNNDRGSEGGGAPSSASSLSSSPPSGPAPDDTWGLFGALYAGSCPQLVPANRQRGGEGGAGTPALPITPLVQRGDVGVIFGVESFQDGPVPTLGSLPRRRIRLVARGLARFRVARVVEKGYEYGSDGASPYIVVEAHVLKDAPLPSLGSEEAEFDRRIRSAFVKLFGVPPDEYLASCHLVPSSGNASSSSKSGAADRTARVRELASFAVASRAMELAGTAQDAAVRMALLRLDDPLERLRRVPC